MSLTFLKRIVAGVAGFFLSGSLLVGAVAGGLFDQLGIGSAGQASFAPSAEQSATQDNSSQQGELGIFGAPSSSVFDYSSVPVYCGEASVQINGNMPFFTTADVQYAQNNLGFEYYGDQDNLARCTVASACVGKETMPAEGEKRGDIGPVKPSGWQTVRYGSIEGKYLYNRCHLLAWQLTDENANANNLITGTRSMNTAGMIEHENAVANYVRSTGNHVLYRVTPLFAGNELVARGVLMEARSIEDDGAGVRFCVWAYNVQPGIAINYEDGSSEKVPLSMEMSAAADVTTGDTAAADVSANITKGSENSGGFGSSGLDGAGSTDAAIPPAFDSARDTATSDTSDTLDVEQAYTYILNTRSHKFHREDCDQVDSIKAANRSEVTATRSEVIAQGYSSCACCNP